MMGAALIAAALIGAASAPVSIGAVVNQGVAWHTSAAGDTLTVTTLVDHAPGTLIFSALSTGSDTLNSISFGGNNFTISAQTSGHAMGYFHNSSAVTAGTTITFTWSSTAGRKYAEVRSVTGLAAIAPTAVGTVTAASSDNPNFSATVADANSLVVAGIYLSTNASTDGYTESAGFTSGQNVAGDTRILRTAHAIAASAGTTVYSATNGDPTPVARSWTLNHLVFKGA